MVNLGAVAVDEAQRDLEQLSRYSFSLAQVHVGLQGDEWKLGEHDQVAMCDNIFTLQAQVFSLMSSDIYPRFLKSEEYQTLLTLLPNGGSVGKGYDQLTECLLHTS